MFSRIGEFIAIAGVLGMVILTGCSPTGWATRDIPDASDIQPGRIVSIVQKDGKEITGTFAGEQNIPASEYFTEYNESISRQSLDHQLPEIGERVEITTSLSDTRAWTGQLIGFDKQGIWIQLPYEQKPTEFYISSMSSLSHGDADIIGGIQFRKLYMNGSLPLSTAFVLHNKSGNVYIPVNSIDKIIEEPLSGGIAESSQ
ncbi:MAG: hypothetical protein ACHQQQ_08950 [Bacteroidota bacterium]